MYLTLQTKWPFLRYLGDSIGSHYYVLWSQMSKYSVGCHHRYHEFPRRTLLGSS